MRWLLAKFLSSATSSRPAWPRKYTGGMFAVIVCSVDPSLFRIRSRPAFSVMRKRPLGSSSTAHGTSRPLAMVVTSTSTVL